MTDHGSCPRSLQILAGNALNILKTNPKNIPPDFAPMCSMTPKQLIMESLARLPGRRARGIETADNTQDGFLHQLKANVGILQPNNRRLESIKGRHQIWIPIGIEAEDTIAAVMPGSATIGATLLAQHLVQVTVTQDAGENG